MRHYSDQMSGSIVGFFLGMYGYAIFTGSRYSSYFVWNVLSQMSVTWFPIAFAVGFLLVFKINFLIVTILVSIGYEVFLNWPVAEVSQLFANTTVEGEALKFPRVLASEFAWRFYALLVAFSFSDVLRMANLHIKGTRSE